MTTWAKTIPLGIHAVASAEFLRSELGPSNGSRMKSISNAARIMETSALYFHFALFLHEGAGQVVDALPFFEIRYNRSSMICTFM